MADGLREWSSEAHIAGWGKRDLEEGWKNEISVWAILSLRCLEVPSRHLNL